MTSSRLQHFLEIYHRTTASGRKVAWDEPSETDSPEIRRHNTFLAKQLQKKRESKDRLKSKGAVPTRDGKAIFEHEQVVTEDIHQVLMSFRRAYQSNRPMRFREWIRMVKEMLDDL
jgi:hypothetical protein